MAGKKAEFAGKIGGICRSSLLVSLKQLRTLTCSSHCHDIRSKPLVDTRYAEGTLKHFVALHLGARALNRKKTVFVCRGCFVQKRLFWSILAVFSANLACGHFFAYTEGPGRV